MITVVVPVYNEQENIKPLLDEIMLAAKMLPISEIIYVDDGSSYETGNILKSLNGQYPFLRVLKHSHNYGQSAAIWTGVREASNDVIVTLDGDGQNDPADIHLLYKRYQGYEDNLPKVMVIGERLKREDSWIKRKSSKIANGIRSSILKDHTRDTGCSLKLFRRRDFMNLPYFDHMHRFLPALMMRDGLHVMHVGVSHRPRIHGVSKYGTLDRAFAGIYDLFGVHHLAFLS